MKLVLRIAAIIRWQNITMIGLIQIMVAYYISALFFEFSSLNIIQFTAILFATLFIAIGGYIINDIYDIDIDKINKPAHLWIPSFSSKEVAKNIYYFITSIGLLLGVFVSLSTQQAIGVLWFILPALALYLYAIKFKKVFVVGNLIVSSLIGFSILIVAFFENGISKNPTQYIFSFWGVIWTLVFFAFVVNLIREIVKDSEDIIGDQANAVQSIPTRYGDTKTKTIISVLILFIIGALTLLSIYLFRTQILISLYLLFGIIPGFGILLSQLQKASTNTHYNKLSKMLKLLMLIGLFSVFLLTI